MMAYLSAEHLHGVLLGCRGRHIDTNTDQKLRSVFRAKEEVGRGRLKCGVRVARRRKN